MSRDYLVRPGTRGERLRDAAIHLTSFVPAVVAIVVVGRPELWLAVFLPLGPLVLGRALAGNRPVGLDHWMRAVDFSLSVAVYALATYGLLSIGVRVEEAGVLVGVGILLLALLVLNWLLFTFVAANRARYGELFDPPGVVPLWRTARLGLLSGPRLKGEL